MKKQRGTTFATGIFAAIAVLALAACTPQGQTSSGQNPAASLKDIKVALVSGGPHPYFQPWVQAGKDAARDFEIGDVTFNENAEWDQTKQTAELNTLGARGYSAFGVFGVSATDINTTFDTIKSNKFAAASIASCPAGDVNRADFCLSTDTEVQAYMGAQATIKAMGAKGNLVALAGAAIDTNTQRRIQGIERAVNETNGAVTLMTTITDVELDLQTAQKAVNDLLASRGTAIGGIVATGYNSAVAAAQGVIETGLPIKVVGTDDDKIVLDGIASGKITGTVVQNPYGQGYVGSWALANIQAGICTVKDPGLIVDSGSFVVTKDNITSYDQERKDATKKILDDFQTKYLSCLK